jgi:Rrf2 family protein
MQLKLTKRGDYALRAMIAIASKNHTELRQARQIAAEMQLPYKNLTIILAGLVRDGLLNASAGPKGGYSLARPVTDITLLDIIQAAEGPVTIDHCVLRDGPCDWENTCPVHDTWTHAQDAITQHLTRTTLADLASIDAAIQNGTHQSQTPPHPIPTKRHGQRT